MKKNRTNVGGLVVLYSILCLGVCVGGVCDATGPGDPETTEGDVLGAVTVTLEASFVADAAAKVKATAAKDPCPAPPPTMDDPSYEAEQDCDNDGGIIRYITPSAYKVAFKRLAFVNADGDLIDVIADTGTLADSEVLDLTAEVTLPVQELPVGEYPTYYAEIYYHELTMPLYVVGDPQTIRVYVSDDDFPSEGDLGHHQGDVTMVDGSDTELGFVTGGGLWQVASLQTLRGSINGAGGTDSETGHLRGLYGDQDLWNRPDLTQGSNQDVFILEGVLSLTLEETGGTVVFSFDVVDAWFFEDFDDNQLFNPCEGGTYDGCGGEWSPVFNSPYVFVDD